MAEQSTDEQPHVVRAPSARRSLVRIGFGLENIGHLALRAPRVTLVIVALIFMAAVASATRLGFDDSLYSIYSNDTADFEHFDMLSERFPVLRDQEVVMFEGPDTTTSAGLEVIRSIHLELQFVDGVLGASSIFSTRERSLDGSTPPTVIPTVIPEGEELDRVLDRIAAHPLAGNRLLAPDRTATLVTVAIDPTSDAVESAIAIKDAAQEVFDEKVGDLDMTINFTGAPLLRGEILSSLRSDQRLLNGIGGAITIALCFAFFGRARLVLIALLPGITGIVCILGSLAAVGLEINAVNSVLPTLVLVIAFADSLHMTSAMRSALSKGLTGMAAARHAVEHVGPACAMTALTTALAFSSLATSSSIAIQNFGFAGAAAASFAFLAVITIIPCLGGLILRPSDGPARGAIDGSLSRLNTRIAAFAARVVGARPRSVAAVGVALLAITTVFYFSVEPRYGYRDFLPDRSPANTTIDRIDTLFGGADNATILIQRIGAATQDARPASEVVGAVHDAASRVDGFYNIMSLKTAEEWVGRDLTQWAETPIEGDNLELTVGEFGLPAHLAARFKSNDAGAWLVTATLPSMDASLSVPMFDRMSLALDDIRTASPGYDIAVTGIVPMTTRAGIHLVSSLNLNLAAAVIVTIALVAFALHSGLAGVLAGLPNLLPLTVAGTALYLTDTGLQITGMVALTVAFGIAVDDTIHLIHRWQLEARESSKIKAVGLAVRNVGPVMIATTIVLTAGIVATLASGLPMVRLFGWICMLTFTTAVIADLFLMPALLIIFARWLSTGNEE